MVTVARVSWSFRNTEVRSAASKCGRMDTTDAIGEGGNGASCSKKRE